MIPLLWAFGLPAQTLSEASSLTNPPVVLTVEGTNVWIQRAQSDDWESAYPQQILHTKDRGRTGADSRTSIRLSDLSVLRIGWHSEFEIQPLPEPEVEAEFSLMRGLLRLLNRDRPGRHRFVTPTATAATRGTEFVLRVEEGTGRTVLTVFEGKAILTNRFGAVRLASGEQGIASASQPPRRTSVIDATAIVQWCLYYPGVLDLAELVLTADEEVELAESLANYRDGDLLRALSAYPVTRIPTSDDERVYLAAVLLAAGQVARSEDVLASIRETGSQSRIARLAKALRAVIDTVNGRASAPAPDVEVSSPLATELLANSYRLQSEYRLKEAFELARQCVEASPGFAFGWTRVAELEFSHGRNRQAMRALTKSLELAPRNAQALALKGFLLAAQNKIREATGFFEQAIAIDGGLGNAWLGRGLCRIRKRQAEAGRFDLQVAASMEPQRSILRSYLGKAFGNAGDARHAMKELKIAEELDPNDPTPWLYASLLLRDLNRINESVRDLERSQALNDNRRVYRSRLLLDQDRAVRGANLANVYADAEMSEVSVREAGRAVNADYANHSGHRFLANSYNELRDINQINLRYETAWFSEYLVANLLAPVGAGSLSQTVSQQEYSKLFEKDGLGLTSSTEYFSHGEWIQSAAQYGTFGNSSYAAEIFYHSDDGNRPNNDLEQFAAVLNFKQQLTPRDSVYLRLNYYDSTSGDVNFYYDQASANPGLRTKEHWDPSLLAGYHHEWAPGSHTLLLAGVLANQYQVENPIQSTLFLNRGFAGDPVQDVSPLYYDQKYENRLGLYLTDLQHIWQHQAHSVVVGGRIQAGSFETRNVQTGGTIVFGSVTNFIPFAPDQDIQTDMFRASLYAYDQWQIGDALLLSAGISYDWLEYPENYRYAPISGDQQSSDQVSPKIGFIWTPTEKSTVRAAYFTGLGGVSLDQSVRLEPSQVAGFNQAYRSLIPESVAGASAAPTFETVAISLEQKVGEATFLGVSAEALWSEVDRTVGVVESAVPVGGPGTSPFSSQGTRQTLDYRETSLLATVNHLLGDKWSLGARYRVSRARLDEAFSDIPATATLNGGIQTQRDLEATLHQARLFALYNHPCGFFARAGAIWTQQSNRGYNADLSGDDFWQLNLEAGYRFARRRAEVRVGLLNLTDQDYQLNPLNLTADLPRERTLALSFQFNF